MIASNGHITWQARQPQQRLMSLGLTIAKHIVVAHGGEIWAETPPNQVGARICFTLPTAD